MHNICFNERQNIWTTRYDWIPLISENIEDTFFSIGGIQSSDDVNEQIWEHDCNKSNVTYWYNKQHGFEFEFVVSDPIGVQKVFDNLQIISNNVQPKEMEITIIGDDYEFKRDIVDFEDITLRKEGRPEVKNSNLDKVTTTSNIHDAEKENKPFMIYTVDPRIKQRAIVKLQSFKDIYKYGRRIGNIQYKEDSWYAQIEPLLINSRKEARIRDKWARIRIRYSGKDLAIITAIKTLINI